MKKIYILFFFYFLNNSAQTVSTFAGSTQGTADGPSTSAQFYGPAGVDLDPAGNLIVADRVNNRIRKITPSGVVSTIAGSVQGFADGIGTNALFNSPMNLTVDNLGNIYVADSGNHRIRKITSDGTVTTIAGSIEGYENGTGAIAKFDNPEGIFIDPNGVIYISDSANNSIRKLTTDGMVSTLAGGSLGHSDGTGTAAQFWTPCGLIVDANGTVFVAEKKGRIRKITNTGVVTTFAGSGTANGTTDSVGINARFGNTFDLTMDASGILYVTDSSNNRIRKILPDGTTSTFAGSTQGNINGNAATSKFNYPIGICISNDGIIYIGESGNGLIRKIITVLASANFQDENNISFYPNPVKDILYLNNNTATKATIYSVLGQQLEEKNISTTATSIDMAKYSKGAYLITLENENQTKTIKVIKE